MKDLLKEVHSPLLAGENLNYLSTPGTLRYVDCSASLLILMINQCQSLATHSST